MLNLISKYPVLSLLICCLLLYFLNLIELPVTIMEARNFNVASEMLRDGNWFLTTMNGQPRFEKPPFPAWFTTLFIQSDIAAVYLYRISTSVVATIGVLFSFYLFKSIGKSKKTAFIGALILATSYYYIEIRFEAPSDIYTHAFMLGALLFLVKSFYNKSHIYGTIILAIICFAISVLSKGPVSLYVLFLPFIIAFFITYTTDRKVYLISLVCLVLGLALGGIWYLYVQNVSPFVFEQIASKETSNWSSYNVRPFYYYWSFFIQSGIWTIPAALSLLYPYYKSKVENPKLYKFTWLWTILAVVLLSFIPEKKSRYLMPVLIPLAFNTAQIISYQIKSKKLDLWSQVSMKIHYSLLFIIGLSVVTIPLFLEVRDTDFWIWYYVFITLMFTVSGFIFFNFNPLKLNRLFFSSIALVLIITTVGLYGIQFLKYNGNYKTFSTSELSEKNLYYFESIRPETIWEINLISKPIDFNKIKYNGEIKVIVENTFLQEFQNNLPEEYTILKTDVLDLNYFHNKESARHKEELMNYIFTLQCKND